MDKFTKVILAKGLNVWECAFLILLVARLLGAQINVVALVGILFFPWIAELLYMVALALVGALFLLASKLFLGKGGRKK